MASMNGPCGKWVLDHLEVRNSDRVLEVGIGPAFSFWTRNMLAHVGAKNRRGRGDLKTIFAQENKAAAWTDLLTLRSEAPSRGKKAGQRFMEINTSPLGARHRAHVFA